MVFYVLNRIIFLRRTLSHIHRWLGRCRGRHRLRLHREELRVAQIGGEAYDVSAWRLVLHRAAVSVGIILLFQTCRYGSCSETNFHFPKPICIFRNQFAFFCVYPSVSAFANKVFLRNGHLSDRDSAFWLTQILSNHPPKTQA